MKPYTIIILLFSLVACYQSLPGNEVSSVVLHFYNPVKVSINGYNDDIMEPFISADGKYLFFNNLNNPAITNTNIYYAEKVNDTVFQFRGEVNGVNSSALDAVASIDSNGHFYFVSTKSYDQNFSTIYKGIFNNGSVSNVEIVPGISKQQPGIVDFDVAITAGGHTMYFAEGLFNNNGQPQVADLIMAIKNNTGFQRAGNSTEILKNINTGQLEYAAALSTDELTLYFTRVAAVTNTTMPRIFYATRAFASEPFNQPAEITEIDGFVEAPTIGPGNLLYYHKMENGRFVLYCINRR